VPGGWGSDDDDANERDLQEARSARGQALLVRVWTRLALRRSAPPGPFLTPTRICVLNLVAMSGVIESAGQIRSREVEITGSRHVPPPCEEVPALLEQMCEVVADPSGDPLFAAAYALWRICWIHPFDDGNGRTARAASYVLLCHGLGLELPGKIPVPARIKHAPRAFTRALEASDKACAEGRIDVTQMQNLLTFYLLAQLRDDPPVLPPGS
jgi:Fic family protein